MPHMTDISVKISFCVHVRYMLTHHLIYNYIIIMPVHNTIDIYLMVP